MRAQEGASMKYVVTVTDSDGKVHIRREVDPGRAAEYFIRDNAEGALMLANGIVCPFDCDNCRDD